MGINSIKQQKQSNKKISSIIKNHYNIPQKSLTLSNLPNDWLDVLQSTNWSHLHQLLLSNCKIKVYQMQVFMGFDFWNLRKLILHNNPIGSKGIKILTKINLKSLSWLNISGCGIGDEGAKHFPKLKTPNLKKLHMEDRNKIFITGYQSFQNANQQKLQVAVIAQYNAICVIALGAGGQMNHGKIFHWVENKQFKYWINLILRERYRYR